MGIDFTNLQHHQPIQKVVIHSLDMALYQVSVVINNIEYYVKDPRGEILKAISPLHIQKLFDDIAYHAMVLRHSSAYDEMCGQPTRQQDNTLEVPYGKNGYY
ncbi:hypothetical protein FIU82_14635 [Pseudoalteromonas sp. THAF3]|uniref:DUF6482 family protein n=1 Tax=Pseudoalteromonas sp. THAF3 TaxID=2587843 RepID=UPI0012694B50|nr:DUF6482 family protein [Pseudoalteromonas sp. THAF3]QFU06223.1 hypothetical protein FIU82_14635 [Pseudoalteromonas sp. THAF3]